jgi:hypothetical protein
MTVFFARNRPILSLAFLLPLVCVVLLMAFAPGQVRSSTYGVVVALFIGTFLVVRSSWRHGQPVASFRQERYDDSHPAGSSARTPWERWIVRADRTAAEGRALAILALSAAVTSLIAYAWLV